MREVLMIKLSHRTLDTVRELKAALSNSALKILLSSPFTGPLSLHVGAFGKSTALETWF